MLDRLKGRLDKLEGKKESKKVRVRFFDRFGNVLPPSDPEGSEDDLVVNLTLKGYPPDPKDFD